MSTTTNEAQITMAFDDGTEKAFTLPSISADVMPYIKTRVQAINEGTAANVADFRATFVSNAGASFVSISGARVTRTVEEVLYSG